MGYITSLFYSVSDQLTKSMIFLFLVMVCTIINNGEYFMSPQVYTATDRRSLCQPTKQTKQYSLGLKSGVELEWACTSESRT